MTAHNFMLADLVSVSAALCLFGAASSLAGYAVGWLTGVLGFRTRSLLFRLVASVPLSVAVLPILGYTIGRLFSLATVWLVVAVLCGYAAVLVLSELRKLPRPRRFPRAMLPFLAVIFVWLVIAFFSLADLQFGERTYYSTIAFDHAVRTAVTGSISSTGIPPQNPFYYPGHAAPLRYHYFWMIPCALVQWLGSPLVDARTAYIAGSMWCGVALICLVPLYLCLFSPQGADGLRRRSLTGICLLGVTGLDIVPAYAMLWLERIGLVRGVSPSVEWWNNQVDGWVYSVLWEAHYVCSLVACLLGFLIVWNLSADSSRRARLLAALIAGACWATASGAGIYVALVFAVFGFVWILIVLARKWYQEAAILALAGVVAGALVAPFFLGLPSYGGAASGRTIHLTLRSFDFGLLVLRVFGVGDPAQLAVANFLLLPLNYFLELGFFFVAGLLAWTHRRNSKQPANRAELAMFTMAVISVAICTFFRSTATHNNDLGWRGFLLAQFVLLLCAADLPAAAGRVRPLLGVTLLIGVAGVAYDLAILRFYPVLTDAGVMPKIGWMSLDAQLGERTKANREAYEWLRARTPQSAVIQQNPSPVFQDTFFGLYGHRQTVASDPSCGSGYGGNPRECPPLISRLVPLYSGGNGSSLQALESACAALPIDVFVAKDTDAAWTDRASWVWSGRPIFANGYVRLFACPAASR